MVTEIRSRASTPGWTCARISDRSRDVELNPHQQVDQNSCVRGLPRSGRDAGLAGAPQRSECRSDCIHHARDGRLDAAIPGNYAGDYSAAKNPASAATDSLSENVGIIRVFLRL